MVSPRMEWPAVAEQASDALALRYVAVLALIPAVARLIGSWLIGGYTPFMSALAGAVAAYGLSFVTVLVVALIIDMLASRFDGQRSYSSALRLTAYAFTPVWLSGIVLLVPGASFLVLLGLYGVYLLSTGVEPLMGAPKEKATPYALTAAACALAVDAVSRILLAAINGAMG